MKVPLRAAFFVSALSLLTACSNHQTATPAAPSSPTAAAPNPAAPGSATISGTIIGMSTTSAWSVRVVNMTVTVVGAASSATVDGNGHFTLVNVPAGRVDLHFMGSGADAHLLLDGVASNQTMTISVRVSGSSATLDNSGPNPGPNSEVELEGLVTAIGASTLTVSGRVANVTSSTMIVHGDKTIAFSSIHVGDRVHVKGTPVSASAPDGPINATKIEVQNPDDADNEDNDKNQVDLKGTIAVGSLAGSCTANTLSFKVGTTTVRTNASTKFDGTSCTALKAGDHVEVEGARQTDASVLASKVEKDDDN